MFQSCTFRRTDCYDLYYRKRTLVRLRFTNHTNCTTNQCVMEYINTPLITYATASFCYETNLLYINTTIQQTSRIQPY
jgi:hypothetical protein